MAASLGDRLLFRGDPAATDILARTLVWGDEREDIFMAGRRRLLAQCFLSGLAVAASGGAAAAETCLARVLALGSRYGVATDPPTAGQHSPDVTTRELARSDGVVEPGQVKDKAVIAPPAGKQYGMPTLPDVETTHDPRGIDLTALQAVLVAARAQAERGNETGCSTTLAKAKPIVERKE
jgi:hypothetical protein